MRVLIDTNVVLDVLLERRDYIADSQQVLSLARHGLIEGVLCATTVTTLDYLITRARTATVSRRAVRALLAQYEIAAVDARVLGAATESDFTDFEDAVIHAAALGVGAEAIVTRDRDGFSRASIPVLSPRELVAAIQARG